MGQYLYYSGKLKSLEDYREFCLETITMLEFWGLKYRLNLSQYAENVEFHRTKLDKTTIESFHFTELTIQFNHSGGNYSANPYQLIVREDTGEVIDGFFLWDYVVDTDDEKHQVDDKPDFQYINRGTQCCGEYRSIYYSFFNFFSRWFDFEFDDDFESKAPIVDFSCLDEEHKKDVLRKYFLLDYTATEPPENITRKYPSQIKYGKAHFVNPFSRLVDKAIVIAARAIGLLVIGFAAFGFFMMTGKLSPSAVIGVTLPIAIPGYFLLRQRQAGCVMFLVLTAAYPLISLGSVLTNETSNGIGLFHPILELILFSAIWLSGLIVFVKKRHLFD